MKRRIMLVDDEDAVLHSIRRLFHRSPCTYGILAYELEIESFVSPVAALARASELQFDAFLSDYRMPQMDGVEFLSRARALRPEAVQILLSGTGDYDAIKRAFEKLSLFRFIAKPWDDATLVSALAEALTHRDLMLDGRQVEE